MCNCDGDHIHEMKSIRWIWAQIKYKTPQFNPIKTKYYAFRCNMSFEHIAITHFCRQMNQYFFSGTEKNTIENNEYRLFVRYYITKILWNPIETALTYIKIYVCNIFIVMVSVSMEFLSGFLTKTARYETSIFTIDFPSWANDCQTGKNVPAA